MTPRSPLCARSNATGNISVRFHPLRTLNLIGSAPAKIRKAVCQVAWANSSKRFGFPPRIVQNDGNP